MLLGQHFGGIAFANAGLGLDHGLAHPLGFRYNIAHGRICGTLLPLVIEYNIPVRAQKYANIAKILSNRDYINKYEPKASDDENALRLTGIIKELLTQIGIPVRLKSLGVKLEDIDWIVANTKGGSVNANPRTPDPESLKTLLVNELEKE
jgi:lactaldehyde reductase